MLTSQQQLEYEYIKRMRRQAMLRLYVKQQYIKIIRTHILSGGSIYDKQIYDKVCYLIDEYGINIFATEFKGLGIIVEENENI